jgi:hypothetical protein
LWREAAREEESIGFGASIYWYKEGGGHLPHQALGSQGPCVAFMVPCLVGESESGTRQGYLSLFQKKGEVQDMMRYAIFAYFSCGDTVLVRYLSLQEAVTERASS